MGMLPLKFCDNAILSLLRALFAIIWGILQHTARIVFIWTAELVGVCFLFQL